MPAAYPEWFRKKVVESYESGGGSFAGIAARFDIGEATVNRWVARKRKTGCVKASHMGGGRRQRVVSEKGEQFIRMVLEDVPDSTLCEVAEAYAAELGVVVDPRRVSEAVRRLGFTRKRGVFRPQAAGRDDVVAARGQFKDDQASLDVQKLVFIDEAGVSLAISYNYGWAPPGETPVIERPMRGKNISLIGAISFQGPLALRRVETSVNGDEFLAFLREDLCPVLEPGSIVVLDGPRIHRVKGVVEALAEVGAVPLYLPAYSPELNPIEMAWAWVKKHLRRGAPRHVQILRKSIEAAWATVTSDLCAGWVRHCGYDAAST